MYVMHEVYSTIIVIGMLRSPFAVAKPGTEAAGSGSGTKPYTSFVFILLFGKPVASNSGLLSMNYRLHWGLVAYYLELLGQVVSLQP